jgi:ATP/maltotriose-dependent transcriptional regulator MalT
MSSAKLTWPRGDGPGKHDVPLVGSAPVLIGRLSSAAVRLDDAAVSRVHAELRVIQGLWTIEDLGSKGGTVLLRHNESAEELRRRRQLRHGDRIKVGRTVLTFHDPPGVDDEGGTILDQGVENLGLTPAELRVLRELCVWEMDGRGGWPSDAEIAATLVIEESTVRAHMKRVYRKLKLDGVPDRQKRAVAIRRVLDDGLL